MSIEVVHEAVRVLATDECHELLAGRAVGRLALHRVDGLDVVPLNYLMDGDDVVFRTSVDGRLATEVAGQQVAFEVDRIDDAAEGGWSVVVRGRAVPVEDERERARLRELPLRAWAPGARDRYVRITASTVTGRKVPEANVSGLWLG